MMRKFASKNSLFNSLFRPKRVHPSPSSSTSAPVNSVIDLEAQEINSNVSPSESASVTQEAPVHLFAVGNEQIEADDVSSFDENYIPQSVIEFENRGKSVAISPPSSAPPPQQAPIPSPATEEAVPEVGWIAVCKLIPGLRQAVDPKAPTWLSVYWVIMTGLSYIGVGILIVLGLAKAMEHSLTVTLKTEEISTSFIPYPAVDIGAAGGFKPDIMKQMEIKDGKPTVTSTVWGKYFAQTKKLHPAHEGTIVAFDQICDVQTTFAGSMGLTGGNQNTDFASFKPTASIRFSDNPKDPVVLDGVIPALKKGMVKCEDILVACRWNGEKIPCSAIFRTTFSEYGSTCTFNGVPDEIRKKHITLQTLLEDNYPSDEEQALWYNVDLDTDAENVDQPQQGEWPKKQSVPGQTSGLTVLLKQDEEDEMCIHTEGSGFRISARHSMEPARLRRFGKTIGFGLEVFVELTPSVTLADPDIQGISKDRRGCYFTQKDHELNYYDKYSQENCIHECISDKIKANCSCSVMTYPGESGRVLCNPANMTCARITETNLYKKGLQSECGQCLPNCNRFKYQTQVTSTAISQRRLDMFFNGYKLNHNVTKLTLAHIYLGPDTTRPEDRSARYTSFELLGLVGGLISLAGLGFIDLADIFITLRKLERPTLKLAPWVNQAINL